MRYGDPYSQSNTAGDARDLVKLRSILVIDRVDAYPS